MMKYYIYFYLNFPVFTSFGDYFFYKFLGIKSQYS